jgi:DNA-binding IclR family transcriptional regulator
LVVSNADGKTAKEISETTGIELSYVWLILRLLFDWGILRLKDGRYYIDEDTRALCGLVIKDMLRDLESWDFLH